MIRPKGLGRGLDALLGAGDDARRRLNRCSMLAIGSHPPGQVPAAHAHGRGLAVRAGRHHPRAGRDAADPGAPGRRRPLRDHRRRAPLARRAARRARRGAGARAASARRGRARDGADREHPARGPEPARGSAGPAAPDRRVRADARAGRAKAVGRSRSAASNLLRLLNLREAGAADAAGRATSTWAMRARCWRSSAAQQVAAAARVVAQGCRCARPSASRIAWRIRRSTRRGAARVPSIRISRGSSTSSPMRSAPKSQSSLASQAPDVS